MSQTYLARAAPVLQHFGFDNSAIPEELFAQAKRRAYECGRIRNYFVIGTSFANDKTSALPSDAVELAHDELEIIRSSGKPYFSKWDENSPLLLFDKPIRFVYHTAGRDFWESLPSSIGVATQDLKVSTLGELMNGLYSPNAHLEAAEGIQEGIYQADPTVFPSWWLKVKDAPNKEGRAESSLRQNQGDYLRTFSRTFDLDSLLFVLKNYGYKTNSLDSNLIIATEKQLPAEDRRSYTININQKACETKVIGHILHTVGLTFDPSEEDDVTYWNRGLDDIMEEYTLQDKLNISV